MKFDISKIKVSKKLGIDLGTSNTLIYVDGKGISLQEPSVAAVNSRTMAVLEVGDAASLMVGKTAGEQLAFRPIKDGVIADYDVTVAMLAKFIRKMTGPLLFNRPKVAMCVPHGVTGVDRRAFEDAALEAGARSVTLIEKPIAAALGAGVKIGAPRGSFIIDIGGGTTEVATVSLGAIVTSNSIRVAGNRLDEAIMMYIKRRYNVSVSPKTAEMLKLRIGSVHPQADAGSMEVRGKNLASGLPALLTVSSGEVRDAMSDQIEQILDCIRSVLEKTPPELCADIYDRGIILTGGCANLRGFAGLLQQITGIRVTLAEKPLQCSAIGLGKFIENPERYPYLTQFKAR
ncbi:MAG: rod shape-determining protein [Clostridia bacterium]|nr:rod shape-determining protein [Clostridia bacterium]